MDAIFGLIFKKVLSYSSASTRNILFPFNIIFDSYPLIIPPIKEVNFSFELNNI